MPILLDEGRAKAISGEPEEVTLITMEQSTAAEFVGSLTSTSPNPEYSSSIYLGSDSGEKAINCLIPQSIKTQQSSYSWGSPIFFLLDPTEDFEQQKTYFMSIIKDLKNTFYKNDHDEGKPPFSSYFKFHLVVTKADDLSAVTQEEIDGIGKALEDEIDKITQIQYAKTSEFKSRDSRPLKRYSLPVAHQSTKKSLDDPLCSLLFKDQTDKTQVYVVSGEMPETAGYFERKPIKRGEFDSTTLKYLQRGLSQSSVHQIDTHKKLAAAREARTLPSVRRVVVLPLDSNTNVDLKKQKEIFREVVKNPPFGTSKIVLTIPNDADDEFKKQAKEFAVELGDLGAIEITAQDVVPGNSHQLISTLSEPSRKEILNQRIDTGVIKVLEEEQKRLKTKYNLLSEEQKGSGEQKKSERLITIDPSIISKNVPKTVTGPRSKETDKQRENAMQRCQELEKTIVALKNELETVKGIHLSDRSLETTLNGFKAIIETNMVNFDKRQEGTLGNWGSKMGRRFLNFLTGLPLALPALGMEAFKKEATDKTSSSFVAEAGRKLGLSNTGMWFRVKGKTYYEGENAVKNVKETFEELKTLKNR